MIFLVYSSTWKDHLGHLKMILITLHQHHLYAQFSKCSFGAIEIEYMGHVLFGQIVAMDHHKVVAIKEWPQPGNIKKLR